MKSSEIIREVRNLLSRPDGWVQDVEVGEEPTPHGYFPMCLVGGLRLVMERELGYRPSDSALGQEARYIDRAIRELYPDVLLLPQEELRINNLPAFNDDTKTTQEDIVAVLEKAAIRAEELEEFEDES